MNTRFVRVVAIFAALALVGAGVALAAAVTVKSAKNPTYGTIVVNSKGFTLYHNTKEKGSIKCKGACAKIWPPLIAGKNVKVKAGPGINLAKLGKIKRPDGRFQVTYFHKPLYRYAPDTKRGSVNGEGIGGIWFAIKASGAVVKAPVGTTTNTTTTGTNPYP